MWHLPIPKSNYQNSTGFTLVELLAILIIVGIMSAISIPSLMAIQGTAKLNNSLTNLRDALEITQFRSSQKKTDELKNTCRIYIPKNNNKVIGNCLITSNNSSVGINDNTDTSLIIATDPANPSMPRPLPRSLDGWSVLTLDENVTVKDVITTETSSGMAGNPPRVVYNLQGLTQNTGTIILGSSVTSDQRCLIVNAGVGLIRSGTYTNNTCQVIE
jgi:type II secretory pathway pseudopilin PulG